VYPSSLSPVVLVTPMIDEKKIPTKFLINLLILCNL